MEPKGEIMSMKEMVESQKQKKLSSSIYKVKAIEATDNAISQTVTRALQEIDLIDKGGKIDLGNIGLVKAISKRYLKACADSSTFPTMSGFARVMGCSRQALEYWMKNKPTSDTAKWLEIMRDLFADVLAEGALRNNANPIVSIFILKSRFGLKDNQPAETAPYDGQEEDSMSTNEIIRKYGELLNE